MELKTPKAKKKSSFARLVMWGRMFRTPLLILFLLGTTNCDESEPSEATINIPITNYSKIKPNFLNHEHSIRHGNNRIQPSSFNVSLNSDSQVLSDIKYLRRHLNKEIVNFVMTDVLVDGEVENRVHYNGITAKETYVGANGMGLKLRQLTDGRHLVQVIYAPNGDIQDCEYITEGKSARNFLKTLRKELKEALKEKAYRLSQEDFGNVLEEKFYRQFGNVSFKILKNGEDLPMSVSDWLDYDRLKIECIERHEELKYMMENRNRVSETSLARFRACLKLADTSVSNMVGKLFFNIVQTKCFVLKPVKVCSKRSWWGKCLRRSYMKQAYLRDNPPY